MRRIFRIGFEQRLQVFILLLLTLHSILKLAACLPLLPTSCSASPTSCSASPGLALQLGSISLSTADERASIETVWQNGVEGLSEEDRGLPQIASMLPLLMRGIGVHHSGLLPILKELVEILFSEGLIKILFATEVCGVLWFST